MLINNYFTKTIAKLTTNIEICGKEYEKRTETIVDLHR